MRPVDFVAILAATFFLLPHEIQAQEAPPKGVLIFKANRFDDPKTARAVEYSQVEFAPVIVNGTDSKGSPIKIMRNCLVDFIQYPDLKFGSIRYPAEIEAFKEANQKLLAASEEFPQSSSTLQPKIDELKIVAKRLNIGQVLIQGRWSVPTPASEIPKPDKVEKGDLKDQETFFYKGKEVTGKIKDIHPDVVLLIIDSGVISVPLAYQSKQIQEKYNYDQTTAAAFAQKRAQKEEGLRFHHIILQGKVTVRVSPVKKDEEELCELFVAEIGDTNANSRVVFGRRIKLESKTKVSGRRNALGGVGLSNVSTETVEVEIEAFRSLVFGSVAELSTLKGMIDPRSGRNSWNLFPVLYPLEDLSNRDFSPVGYCLSSNEALLLTLKANGYEH